MRTLFPEIEPYATGLLQVDDLSIYWETSGNPDGAPVVFLHGGPGGGTTPTQRRVFDPARYRIVLVDQRGCGRSTPHAGEIGTDLTTNTTWHLVADLELLRAHLGIGTWHVFGGSWGSTLALAYAQTHPDRVRSLVLRGIFTLRRAELDWFYEGGAAALFPDAWEQFCAPLAGVPRRPWETNQAVYHRLLEDPDPAVHLPAAIAWSVWEASTVRLRPDPAKIAEAAEPLSALAFARIENHYFVHSGWLAEGELIANADRLAGIPGVIVQGRYDVCTPPVTAWDLHRAWPRAQLVITPDAGHAFDEPATLDALITATDAMADLPG
jgi:proline iminopeptidase